MALGPQWLDPSYLISAMGPFVLVGLGLIIFAECGLLLGFFLPGDSLLFTAGLFVASGAISAPLWLVCTLLVVSALLGNLCGYWIGRAAGPAIFDRPNSRLLKTEHVERTQAFFERYGNRAILLGRFVPIVRTFITVMAGVGKMAPKRYLTYSVLGGVAWAAGVTLLGYLLGRLHVRPRAHRVDAGRSGGAVADPAGRGVRQGTPGATGHRATDETREVTEPG